MTSRHRSNRGKKGPRRTGRPGSRKRSEESKSEGIRLNKYIANSGVCSRREADMYIEIGSVSVNGKVITEMGFKVQAGDEVRFDGARISPEAKTYVLLNKPKGFATTTSESKGRTVMDLVANATSARIKPIGRLGRSATGLLLFTNDGALAHALMHPSHALEREYACRIYGTLTPQALDMAASGVRLDDGMARFDSVHEVGGEGRNRWYEVTVREGRNRLVRRLWQALGVEVSRLTRVRYGPVTLPRRLRAGRFECLSEDACDALYRAAGMSAPRAPPRRARRSGKA